MGDVHTIGVIWPYWKYQVYATLGLLPALGALLLGEFFPRITGSFYFSVLGFVPLVILMLVNLHIVSCFRHGTIPRVAKNYITAQVSIRPPMSCWNSLGEDVTTICFWTAAAEYQNGSAATKVMVTTP